MNIMRLLRRVPRKAGFLLIPILPVYLFILFYMFFKQRSWIFNIDADGDSLPTIQEEGFHRGLQEERVVVGKNVRVTVWRKHRVSTKNHPYILYIHGRAGHLARRRERFDQVIRTGYRLYAPVHRGFPGSDGKSTEKLVIRDAVFHYDRIRSMVGEDHPIVIHGESLGTAIATAVAEQRPCSALILEAPCSAIVDLVAEKYPWLPVKYMLHDRFLTRKRIVKVQSPILIIHGKKDTMMPIAHGRLLHNLPKSHPDQVKSMIEVDWAGHYDLWKHGLWDNVQDFLDKQGILEQGIVKRAIDIKKK